MKSVLLVDDENFVCENIKLKIDRLNYSQNLKIYSTNSANQAFNIVKSNEIDIIFTDIKMPYINGLDFIKKLRSNSYSGRILVLSGYDDFDYVRTAFLNGADDYLLKPVSVLQLKDKLDYSFRNQENKVGTHNSQPDKEDDKITNIIEYALLYINENYTNSDLSMKDVAEHVSVSYNHFSSLFRKETHKSFPTFLLDIRIQKAIELLSDPTLKINDICYKVGFKYPQQFSRDFKKITGLYPKQYRK